MARIIRMTTQDGREFVLGKFNEGKRTEEQITKAVIKKYHNMFKRLALPGYQLEMETKTGVYKVPIEQFINSLQGKKP